MTWEQQSSLKASGIEWPALRCHIPFMAHVFHLSLGAIIRSFGVTGCTTYWQAYVCYGQFGENESTVFANSERLWKGGKARISKVSAMRLGLAGKIEKAHIPMNFGCPQSDLHSATNACCIEYAVTRLSKQVHWLLNSQSRNCGIINYVGETQWNLTLGLFEWANWIQDFTREWCRNRKCSDQLPPFPTQDECTIIKYLVEVLGLSQYGTLWVSKILRLLCITFSLSTMISWIMWMPFCEI